MIVIIIIQVKGWDEWTPHASDGLTLLSETSAQQAPRRILALLSVAIRQI